MLISQAEFARLANVSRSAVKQAINSGIITAVTEQNGRIFIDKNEALEPYIANCRKSKKTQTITPAPIPIADETNLDLLSWGSGLTVTEATSKPTKSATKQPEKTEPNRETLPEYGKSRARSEYERANLLELERKTKEEKLAYIEDMEIAYNAVLLQLTTKAGSLHKQIKADIPHLTHRELDKIERRISDIFESVASHGFEDLPE